VKIGGSDLFRWQLVRNACAAGRGDSDVEMSTNALPERVWARRARWLKARADGGWNMNGPVVSAQRVRVTTSADVETDGRRPVVRSDTIIDDALRRDFSTMNAPLSDGMVGSLTA